MSMKTILVPMEPHEGMSAVLETALLLARKRGSYIEGFPLRFGISEFVAVDPAGSIPLESYRQESQEEAAQARKLFESFMQQRGIPQSSGAAGGLSCGWFDDAPEATGNIPVVKNGKMQVANLPGLGILLNEKFLKENLAEGEPWWG